MTVELLGALVRANLAGGAAILLVLLLRPLLRKALGPEAAYRLWILPFVAAAASLAPLSAGAGWTAEVVLEAAPLRLVPSALAQGGGGAAGLVLGGWALGAALAAAALAVRQARFVRGLGRLTPEVIGGRRVLRAERAGVGPAVVGLTIVAPADFEARFTPEEQQAVLAHEAMHLARGDVAANALAALAQCLCWFNPLVHLAAFKARLDQELACDAAVLAGRPGARRSYAEALLKTQLGPALPPLGCAWPSRAEHPLKARIAMLKQPSPSRLGRAAGAALVIGLSAGGGLAAWAAQPGAVHLITRPDWAERPAIADLVRFYPAAAVAKKLPGEAVVQCRVGLDGTLSGCRVLRAAPQGEGFGEAALALTPLFRMKPMSRDGQPVAGGIVRIPIAFRIAGPAPTPAK